MAPKANRTGSTAQVRSHSRSSSATRASANLQFTQKDSSGGKGAEKSKKHPYVEGGRPGFPRANSSQRVPSATQIKRTASASSTGTQQKVHATNANAKPNVGFTLKSGQSTDDADEDDDDEWVSSSGAQTPNKDDSDSDTASEGSSIPQELVQQLQRTQLEQQRQQEAPAARAQALLPRVETARQSDFNPSNGAATAADVANLINGPGAVPKSAPPAPSQTPFPTADSEPFDSDDHPNRISQQQHYQAQTQGMSSDHGGDGGGNSVPGFGQSQSMREANHSRPETRQTHSSKRQSVTRPPSSHSVSSRIDSMRPHPLIRGHSQGYLNLVPKPTPLAPLTVITDQPNNSTSSSPESIKTTITSPGGYTTEFPTAGRRTSISSVRSVATLPAQSAVLPSQNKPYDRKRTLSTLSMNASSSALNSLTHLPSFTRPPSPQQISFFPPVNPHVNIEAIHPLLPGPYLNSHLTVLARRTPLRESYDRVMQAKLASGLR